MMRNKSGFIVVSEISAQQILKECSANGWKVFRLPGNMADKSDFFSGVRDNLPLDPQLVSNSSWDALADSLWEGLVKLTASQIAILWPNASKMEREAPKDYEIIESLLSELPKSLSNVDATLGRTKQILILQLK